jgi:hypothetical protein
MPSGLDFFDQTGFILIIKKVYTSSRMDRLVVLLKTLYLFAKTTDYKLLSSLGYSDPDLFEQVFPRFLTCQLSTINYKCLSGNKFCLVTGKK